MLTEDDAISFTDGTSDRSHVWHQQLQNSIRTFSLSSAVVLISPLFYRPNHSTILELLQVKQNHFLKKKHYSFPKKTTFTIDAVDFKKCI